MKSTKREQNEDEKVLQLEGRNAILEALKHDKTIDKILIKKGEVEGTLKVIIAKAKEKNIVIQEVLKTKLDEISVSHNASRCYCHMSSPRIC